MPEVKLYQAWYGESIYWIVAESMYEAIGKFQAAVGTEPDQIDVKRGCVIADKKD